MFKNLNYKLILVVICLLIIGEFSIFSAGSVRHSDAMDIVSKQILWTIIGWGLIIFIISAGYNRIIEAAYPLYIIVIIMLMLVIAVGPARLGAQRWIALGSFNIQPSEFAKFVFILTLARFFGFERRRIDQISSILIAMGIFSLFFVLVLKQPDLGTALSFMPILLVILLVGGLNFKYLISFFAVVVLTTPFLWAILRDYQKKRLLVFLNPNIDPLGAGYTIIQSKIAIGSGGLFGKGYLMGTQSQLKFLPEAHTDFIFAVISEEWGFFGVLVIMALYFILIMEGFNIALRCKSNYARLLASGITTMFAFHFLINISMTGGLVPVVGIPLPFISYGGSNLLVSLAGIGILLSIDKERRRGLFL